MILLGIPVAAAAGETWSTNSDWNNGAFSNTTTATGNLTLDVTGTGSDVVAANYANPCQRGNECRTNQGDWIDAVWFTAVSRSSGDNSGHLDATGSISSPLVPGKRYNLTVRAHADTSGPEQEYVNVSFDWNQNQDISDDYTTGPAIGSCYTGSPTCNVSNSILVPESAPRGSTLMRIVQEWSQWPTSFTNGPRYGEVEDYSVFIGDYVSSGTYTTEWRDTGRNASWYQLNYDFHNLDADTDIVVQVDVSHDGSSVAKSTTKTITGPGPVSINNLPNARYIRLTAALSTTNASKSPRIDLLNASHKPINTTSISTYDTRAKHQYNATAVVEAPSGSSINSCQAYFKENAPLADFQKLNTTFKTFIPGYGAGNEYMCSGIINTTLPGVGPNERVRFKFKFTDTDGVVKNTTVTAHRVPNTVPSINSTTHRVYSNRHAFNFSSVGYDPDADSTEISSCTIYAQDQQGNQYSLGSLDQTYGGVDQAACNATISSSLGAFEVGETIDVWAEFADTSGATATSSTKSYVIPNHAPQNPEGPFFEDQQTEHGFNVSGYASDPDGESDFSSCTVVVNDRDGNTYNLNGDIHTGFGDANQASCNYSAVSDSLDGFQVEEVVDTYIRFNDAYGGSVDTVISSYSIPNKAPAKPFGPNFTDPNIDLSHVLDHSPMINWTNPDDPENDSFSIRIYTESSKNPSTLDKELSDVASTGVNNTTIGSGVNLLDGVSYNVTLEACDAWDCSSRSQLLNFTMNAKPNIVSVELNDSELTDNDNVHFIANITDGNSDLIKYANFTIWDENGTNIALNKNGTRSGTQWNSTNWTLTGGHSYNWTLHTSDGFETKSTSGSFGTNNAAPSIVSGPTFWNYPGSHRFNVSAAASDSNIISNYTIHLDDGEETHSFTRNVTNPTGNTYYANFSAVAANLTGFQIGESIDVHIVFRDKQSATATTPTRSHAIPNRPPTIDGLNATPVDPFTNRNLNTTFNISDPEGDAIPTRLYRWYENGSATSITSRTVDASTTTEYTNWSVEFQVRDEYGAYSTANFSNNVTIQNQPPQAGPLEYRNSSTAHLFFVNATAVDIDGQDDVNSCTIHYAGSSSKAGTLSHGYGDQNEVLCEGNISVDDGVAPYENVDFHIAFSDESSNETNSLANVVPNQKPSISLSSPLDGSEISSSSVTFDWRGADVEGDTLEYNITVYNDGAEVHSSTTSQESASVSLGDGNITWNVTVSDSYNTNYLSSTSSAMRGFTLDATPPNNLNNSTSVVNSSRSFPTEHQAVEIVTRWSDPHLDAVTIYENQTDTNHSVAIVDGWANYTLDAGELEAGTVSYTAYARDTFNNTDSVTGVFNVSDVTAPNITGFTYSPSAAAGLDPGETVYVNASVTDNLKVSSMKLQYRQIGGSWNNSNFTGGSGKLEASFVPKNISDYEFRVVANDTYNNTATVSATENIDFENTWTRTPADIGDRSSTLADNLTEFSSIVVENTGDRSLNYTVKPEVEDTNLDISINTTGFFLDPGETMVVDVNASLDDTSSSSEGVYAFNVSLNATNATAAPDLLKSEGTATFTLDKPYLEISEDLKFPNSITQGETDSIPVEVSNIGGAIANDTTVTYEIPSGWSATSGTTTSIGDIPEGSSNISSIEVTVGKNASSGTQVINISAEAANRNKVFESSFRIDVIENSTSSPTQEETVFLGGGGSGDSGPRISEGEGDKLLNTTSRFEIVRGDDQNFTITFENPTRFNLTNITIGVTGFQSQYLGLGTEFIRKMAVNESRNITVAINAPEYFSAGSYSLNFTIRGTGVDPNVFYGRYFNFTLQKIVELRVHEISRERATELVEQIRDFKEEMAQKELRTRKISNLLEEAETALQNRDYVTVQSSFEEAQQTYSMAMETRSGLKELSTQISTAKQQGLTVDNAARMKNLAEAALERGDYDTASNRLEEARNLYALQTKGQVNWIYLILSNWKKILAGIVLAAIISVIGYYRYLLYSIRTELEELEDREDAISEMKKEDQRATFERQTMSIDEYEDAVADYNQEMIDIVEKRAELESRKANITNLHREASLEQQKDLLKDEIQRTQRRYVEGEIGDTEIYETKVEELTKQLSTVEGDLAEIAAERNSESSLVGRIERLVT